MITSCPSALNAIATSAPRRPSPRTSTRDSRGILICSKISYARGERLDEDRAIHRANRIGKRNEVAAREGAGTRRRRRRGREFRARCDSGNDVRGPRGKRAISACGIDLADDATSAQSGILGLDHFADELMTGNSPVSHVAFREFEIGAANPRHVHAHDAFAGRLRRFGMVAPQRDSIVDYDCTH